MMQIVRYLRLEFSLNSLFMSAQDLTFLGFGKLRWDCVEQGRTSHSLFVTKQRTVLCSITRLTL